MAGKERNPGDEQGEVEARVDALIERGLDHYAQGDVRAALNDWAHALALDPGCARARRHHDEVSRHLETLEGMLSAADRMDEPFPLVSVDAGPGSPPDGAAAGAPGGRPASRDPAEHIRAADTIEEGWPLIEDTAEALPRAPDASPDSGDLMVMARELLGTARPGRPGAAPERIRRKDSDTWDDEWTREPTLDGHAIEAYATALAPTVELVLPAGAERLFETMHDIRMSHGGAAGELPAAVPPVIIEEVTPSPVLQTAPHSASRSRLCDQGGTAEEILLDGPDIGYVGLGEVTRESSVPAPAGRGPIARAAAPPPSPVALRLFAALDREVPADDEDDESLRRRVSWLIERAEAECVSGDLEAAIIALELALDERPDSAVAQKLIHRHGDTLLDIYERYIDNPAAVPILAISPIEFHEHAIDSRAAFLLSRIDGVLTIEDILDVSGMPRLEAYRYLCGMLRQGILALR